MIDFVIVAATIIMALIGARVGLLNMVFLSVGVYAAYLLNALYAAAILELVRDNIGDIGDFVNGLIDFGVYSGITLLILVLMVLLARLTRKFLKVFLLAWVDRTGGAIIGIVSMIIGLSLMGAGAAWVANSGQQLLVVVELSNIAPDSLLSTAVDSVNLLTDALNSSFFISELAWPIWTSIWDPIFPNEIFGISVSDITESIRALDSANDSP